MQETHLAVAVALSSSLHRKFLHYRGIHHQASSFQESTLMSFTAMTINRLIAERDKAHAENERLCRELTTSIESERLALRNNEELRRELAEARKEAEYLRHYKEVSDVESRLAEAEIKSVQSELGNTRDKLTSVCDALAARLAEAERTSDYWEAQAKRTSVENVRADREARAASTMSATEGGR
jgi:hypothetical protein